MALVAGMLQVEAMDAAERNLYVLVKNTTEQFARSTTTSEQLPFEQKAVRIWEDSYLRLLIQADAAATLDVSESVINVPVTQYVVAGGRGSAVTQPAEIMLTAKDFKLSDTDVALPAGTHLEIGRYKVPAGTMIVPGWGEYSALNTAKGRVYIKVEAGTGT